MWSGQRRIAEALTSNRRVACASAHGLGKGWLAAGAIGWWVSTRVDPFIVTSAPTGPQLTGILWRELHRHHRRAELPGTITLGQVPTWRIGGELRGWGRKPADLADPEQAAAAFSGIHARSVLVVLDEASGLDDWLWDASASLMTSDECRLLAIGNPLDPASRFARVCSPGSGFETIHLSAFDSPNFTGEKVNPELAAVLPSETWVNERRQDWGEGSPQWIARVEGEFPPSSPDTLIQPAWLQRAQATERPSEVDPRLGVDVARSGHDHTVVAACWREGRIRIVHDELGQDTMATAGAVKRLLREFGGETVAAIDVVGLGAGVFDRLREQSANVREFSSATRALDPTRFVNRRAEAFWRLREELEGGRIDLDPHDDQLAAQLGSLKWGTRSDGRIFIESKDQLRSRGLPSPDRADAAAMALAKPSGMTAYAIPLMIGREGGEESEEEWLERSF
jgi:hypothetical protein